MISFENNLVPSEWLLISCREGIAYPFCVIKSQIVYENRVLAATHKLPKFTVNPGPCVYCVGKYSPTSSDLV